MRKIILKKKCEITSSIFKSKSIEIFWIEISNEKGFFYFGINNDKGGNQ
jgi:hypothetical protein